MSDSRTSAPTPESEADRDQVREDAATPEPVMTGGDEPSLQVEEWAIRGSGVSLRRRFLTLTLAILCPSVLIVLALVEFIGYRNLHDDLLTKVDASVAINSQILAVPLWNLDDVAIRRSLEAVLRDDDVIGVRLIDNDGSIFDAVGESSIEAPGSMRRVAAVVHTTQGTTHELGSLEVVFTRARIRAQLRQRLILDGSLFALLVLTVSIALAVAERRVLGMPLERLAESIGASLGGHRRQPVRWSSDDELGDLIREYNRMIVLEEAAQAETASKSEFLEATLDNIEQGLCVYDNEYRLAAFNPRFLELSGYEDPPPLGTELKTIIRCAEEESVTGEASIEAVVENRLAMACSSRPHHWIHEGANGAAIEIRTRPMPGGGLVSTYTDITERTQYEERLRHLALHDPLTGMANRTLLAERVRHDLASAARSRNRIALLYVDLDRFKGINEGLGHQSGDQLLIEVARRLREVVRKTDTAARIGGDEFAVVQTRMSEPEDAGMLAQRILDAVAEAIDIDGQDVHVTAAVGITVFPDDTDDPEQLLRNADLATFAAKARGPGQSCFFQPHMNALALERRTLEEDLRVALAERQLELHYQPRIDLKRRTVTGAEALVRWRHPERGLLLPASFIPLAESSGLILEIGSWALEVASRQAQEWAGLARRGFRIAVNLSAANLQRDDVVGRVRELTHQSALLPELLDVEITESQLLSDTDRVVDTLSGLRALGLSIAIDDFGTGYSSLTYLRHLPVDTLKIDRSFVSDVDSDSGSAAIVEALIKLAHSLELNVTAEGIETPKQLALLVAGGCDEAQGFLFSPALPPTEFSDWLSGTSITDFF